MNHHRGRGTVAGEQLMLLPTLDDDATSTEPKRLTERRRKRTTLSTPSLTKGKRNRSEGARRYAATGSGQIRGGCCAWGKRDGGGAAVVRAAQASVR